MRNFKVVKGDQQSRRNFQKLRLLIPENPLGSLIPTTRSLTTPVKTIEGRRSLPMMNAQVEFAHAYEALLTRWQGGAESVISFLQHRKFEEWSKWSSPDQGPVIFQLIEALVPVEEQFDLCKEFLEADLISQRQSGYMYSRWRESWNAVLRCEDWDNSREMLDEDEVISQVAGTGFLSCALVIVAEHHLRDCRNRIENPTKFKEPLLRSCDLGFCNNHENSEYCESHSEQYPPHAKYIDILRDFRDLRSTVDPSFYKYALEIIEWNPLGKISSREKSLAITNEYRRKYLHLINQYNCVRVRTGRAVTEPRESIVPWTSPTANSTASTQTSATERPSTSDSTSGFLTSTSSAFEILFSKWKSLTDFNEYAVSILPLDGLSVSIFDISTSGNDNLFSIIHSCVPIDEQIPLVRALLDAFANVPLTSEYSPWSLSWWCSVYASTSWDKFLTRLDRDRIGKHLERVMGPHGSKLFMDAVVLLVGEKLLLDLGTRLVVLRREAYYSSSKPYRKLESQYTAIMREIQERGMKLEPSWLNYHLSIL